MAKQTDEVQVDYDKLKDDVAALKEDLSNLFRDGVSGMKGGASEGWEQAVDKAEGCIKERPFMCVLGAAAFGLVLGSLLRGGR